MLHSIQTITAKEMRGVNRTAVLEVIRTQGPISRTRIAKELQVSLPTVMRVVNELIAEDLVRLTGNKEASGGRKRPLLEFNAHEHLIIGIDMSATNIFGAVIDLSGDIIAEKNVPINKLIGVEAYDLLEEVIYELLNVAKGTKKNIRGIGIGAPGITYFDKGVVKWVPTLEWRDFPLKKKLQDKFDLPVMLDNDVNLSALGEMWFGEGFGCKNLVFIIIDQGIGAGIVIDGSIYRGSHLTAGEIGFLIPNVSALNDRWEGFGATESISSIPGIIARAREAIHEDYSVDDAIIDFNLDAIFSAYKLGHNWAQTVINETINHLSQIIASVSVCFDPDVIVLSGEMAKYSDILIKKILSRIDGRIPLKPKVVKSSLGYRAAIMGIVINVLHNTTDFYVIQKLE